MFSIGVDQDTGASVVIKLEPPNSSQEMDSLENEYHNYLLIGAEGNLSKKSNEIV